jgi:two-component system LytT family response regulator
MAVAHLFNEGSEFLDNATKRPLLRVVVADNDSVCRESTKNLLASEGDAEVVAECTRGEEISVAVHLHRPDLLLFDPQIPAGNRFELFARAHPFPLIIFISALDQYALKAFEAGAFDYILKPLNRDRFHLALERARADVKRPQHADSGSHWTHLRRVQQLEEGRLIVKCEGRVIFLESDEIDWIEASANYVKIHAGKEVYRLREPIGRIEKRVAARKFSRIHRSIIVNMTKIKELYPCNSGEYMVRLKSGRELACSRSYNASIRELLESG